MGSETWKSEARNLSNRALAEKANVSIQMCATWGAESAAASASEPSWYEWLVPITAGAQQTEAARTKLEAEEARTGWCERRDFYQAELARRRQTDATVAETEAEVAEELEGQREVTREKIRKTEQDWEDRGGIVGAPIAAAGDAVATAGDSVLGFFGRIRENALGVFGLASDQPFAERLVGIARLALAAVAIYVVWMMAGRVTSGAVALGERSAGRIQTGLETVKDIKIPGAL